MNHKIAVGWVMVTLFCGLILTIISLPVWATWLRPLWMMIILVYWSMALERWVGVGLAWCVGIVLDIFSNTLLGEHALALTIVVFVVMKMQKQVRVMPIFQQSLVIFVLALLYLALLYWPQRLMNEGAIVWLYWLPAVTTFLLWPWLFALLRAYRRYFGIS